MTIVVMVTIQHAVWDGVTRARGPLYNVLSFEQEIIATIVTIVTGSIFSKKHKALTG